MPSLVASLEGLKARDRERAMLAAIGRMARGELLAEQVRDEADLRQLAYLASLARNRVRLGGERLTEFMREARARFSDDPRFATTGSGDPLLDLMGARWPLDSGKVRSEADLHVEHDWASCRTDSTASERRCVL